jgi:hypothetical protein
MYFGSQFAGPTMSLVVSRAVWELSKAKETSRLVLLCLADHANNQGLAWPCVRTIAHECQLSRRGVQKILQKLLASGELTVDQVGGGKAKPTRYRITANGGSLFGKCRGSQRANVGTDTANTGSPEPLTSSLDALSRGERSDPLQGLSRAERFKANELRCNVPAEPQEQNK